MKPASFPRDLRREAKKANRPLLRIQIDSMHLGGESVEVVGHADESMAIELRDLLQRWRQATNESMEVAQ